MTKRVRVKDSLANTVFNRWRVAPGSFGKAETSVVTKIDFWFVRGSVRISLVLFLR
jgi:hypothetical protein